MKKSLHIPIPVAKSLRKLGNDLSTSRRKRRISFQLMSKRTGLSRSTLAKIEKGDPSVSMAGYACVLFVLGLTKSLGDIADFSHDITGHLLEEERLPKRICYPREKKKKNG